MALDGGGEFGNLCEAGILHIHGKSTEGTSPGGLSGLLWVLARVYTSIFPQILPGPAEHCSEANFNPPTTAGEIFARIFVSGGCSDLIFSGHMLYVITVTCALCKPVVGGPWFDPWTCQF